ncbi:penicillin-binding protein 1C [Shimia marina]|uniref:peptidoglycan glycosyltransferase n=1 Tax=Shimia marina TaxID=321267 RepID=A0A0P1EMV2_9RHOB|nr:penicillin-binding protein 1C [Shimia marina]CUH51643.1 Penicillin-binding protein F [Shimia marina]SFD44026.1 penicillin-binding protein 1C [Shimia marina]
MRLWLAVLLVGGLLFFAGARDALDRWINATELPPLLAETSVEVLDRKGALLRAYTVEDGLWRMSAAVDDVDPTYLAMLVAYEDARFWQHQGIDFKAFMRAAWQALTQQRVVSGGSTLTMQVARLIEDSGTGAWAGKLRQIRVALALEKRLSKTEILQLYLSHAPFGGNLEGIRAATLSWFGKEPHRLTPAESALLVALPQSPNARRPDRHPEAAQAARDRVLYVAEKKGVLTEDDVQAAQGTPIAQTRRAFPVFAPHMADRARYQDPLAQRHHLTLDLTLQKSLEALAAQAVRGLGRRLSVAMIVADHESGEILASVGSAGFGDGDGRQGFIDMTQAKRSPGSTLKPLVYGLSFDQGLVHPESLISDRPVHFDRYAPQNFDGQFRGDVRVREALALSLNIPVVLLTDEIGPANLMVAMRRAGLRPEVPGGAAGLAVALGGVGVSLEELVSLYAMFPQGGEASEMTWKYPKKIHEKQRIISRSAAWHLGDILSEIAPPVGAVRSGLAYKTGTSYGHRDTWALGFDGRHVAGVWIGRPDGTPVPGAFGAEVAAPVLFELFQRLKPELDPLPPPPPETLIVSHGQLPEPLKKFKGRQAVFEAVSESLELAFPPQGARLSQGEEGVVVKVRNAAFPLTFLANGQPVLTNMRRSEVRLPMDGKGQATVTVIDATGRSDQVTFWVD